MHLLSIDVPLFRPKPKTLNVNLLVSIEGVDVNGKK
jgi:hypothetical protein